MRSRIEQFFPFAATEATAVKFPLNFVKGGSTVFASNLMLKALEENIYFKVII
jgi:hypothetical protein